MINKIHTGDCIDIMRTMPDRSVNCCVTSPPYYGLRDYGTATWEGGDEGCSHKRDSKRSANGETGSDGVSGGVGDAIYKDVCLRCGAVRIDDQIGLEETPEAYVQKLVKVFREVKRVLRDDGTLWLNLGDSYSSYKDCKSVGQTLAIGTSRETAHEIELGKSRVRDTKMLKSQGLKNKDLIGIPWMVAFALRADGWYLRQDIIWHKPNPMPESVTDRCTKSHEYIFLLSKSQHYYYDHEAIKTPIAKESIARLAQDIENQKGSGRVPGTTNGNMKAVISKGLTIGGKKGREYIPEPGDPNYRSGSDQWGRQYTPNTMANKKSVWTITTKPFKDAHFATFPEDLIVPCIKAGCPEGGVVLDPFGGAGTTAVVAHKLQRKWILTELNPEYVAIAERRLYPHISQATIFDEINAL